LLKRINFTLALVMLIGIALSGAAYFLVEHDLKLDAQLQFERQSEPVITALKLRVKSFSLGLRGARTVPLMVDGALQPQHFQKYIASRKIAEEFPGALGFGFIRLVPPQEVDAYVAEQRKLRPQFAIRTLAEHAEDKFIIEYIEPLAPNQKAIGLDIGSEALRRSAALMAMTTGEMAMTAPIQLVQAGKAEAGFLVLLPYYSSSPDHSAVLHASDREQKLIGWVYAPVLISKMVTDLNNLAGPHIDFEIYSGRQIDKSTLIYDDDNHVEQSGHISVEHRPFARQVEVELGGQIWTLVLSSSDNFNPVLDQSMPATALTFGLVLTFFISFALHNATRLQIRAQALAEAMSLQAKRREIQLDAVLDSTSDAIVTADKDGTIVSTNQTMRRLLGYEPEAIIGKNVSVLMGDADAAEHPRYLANFRHGGKTSVMGKGRELWAKHADGHLLPIEVNLNQFELSGEVFLVAQIHDISLRWQQENALRASQRQLSMIVDSAGIGTWDLNLVNGEAYFGGIYGEMLGYVTSELPPNISTWRELVHPNDLTVAQSLLDAHLRGASPIFSCELRMKTAQNSWHWVHTIGRVYERDAKNKALKMAGIHLDVDTRKRNELVLLEKDKSLQQLQQQLSSVINSATEISIIATDEHGLIEVFNVGAEKMLGYTAAEMVGQQTPLMIHDEHEISACGEQIAAETGIAVSGFGVFVYSAVLGIGTNKEWTYICKDGNRLTVNLMITARHNDAGKVVGYLVVATNITEQKRVNAMLAAATAEAVQASQAKSDFLANMSHEIRTPMNAVIGFSNLLADTPLNDTQRDFVHSIQQSGDALLSLINDILDFSKIEAGHLELEHIEFDLRYLLEGAIDIVAEKALKQRLHLACIVDPCLPQKLLGDPGRIRQILLNLLNNAIKFTTEGEVVARISMISRDAHQCSVRFMVKDSGIGMSAAAKEKLFKPFTQADSSTTRRFGGTGLGLSISKRLVESMHGQIGVASEVGEGSEFWFEIPLPIAMELEVQQAVPLSLQHKKVLVVDDFAANRELIQLQLETFGIQPSCFGSPSAALACLQAAPADYVLALIDLQMPEMDGIALANEIQKIEACASMPLICLSSMAVPGIARDAKSAGFSAFLTKPIRQSQLIHAIEETLKLQQLPKASQPLVTVHHLAEQIAAMKPYILLAEDNPVNQKVAVLMLEKLGCRVDVANNGKIALEAVQQHAYDIVLMDCQMPEMDGFAATAAIRALPTAAADVHIVALTANAFQSDIDHCYAVGMNDFVSKPIYLDEITRVIQRGLEKSDRLMQPKPEPVMQSPESHDLNLKFQQDLKDMHQMFADLERSVGIDLKVELLPKFAISIDECLTGLQQALNDHDLPNANRCAHKLKGASGQLGANHLAELCKAIEIAGQNNDLDNVKAEAAKLFVLGNMMKNHLNSHLNDAAPTSHNT
jgi:PAS domain S-box-containing protein